MVCLQYSCLLPEAARSAQHQLHLQEQLQRSWVAYACWKHAFACLVLFGVWLHEHCILGACCEQYALYIAGASVIPGLPSRLWLEHTCSLLGCVQGLAGCAVPHFYRVFALFEALHTDCVCMWHLKSVSRAKCGATQPPLTVIAVVATGHSTSASHT